MKKLVLRGSPKEIGERHGQEGKIEVIQSLETYERLFFGYQKINWKQAKEYALAHVEAISKHDQQLIEEMEGVANGAGVDFEDILALNARSEIALANYKRKAFSDGCTALAVTQPVSSDTIIGQNWDWKGQQKKSLLQLEIHIEGKPVVTMVTEGGLIGKIGYNSAGLGICFNALLSDKKSNEVPIHLALRSVLNSFSLHEAISKIKGGQTAAAANFLIGKAENELNGMVVNVEISPFGIDMIGGNDGVFVHTNHICSDYIKTYLNDMNEFKYDDSILRKKRAEQLIYTTIAKKKSISHTNFKEWLSDTFNAPNSINHYKNKFAPEHRRMETVFSIIMNLSKRKILLCVGNPSVGKYKEI